MEKLNDALKAARSISIGLPDGSYGRPFDNEYTIISLKENMENGCYEVIISDGIGIKLYGDIKFKIDQVAGRIFTIVEIYSFSKLIFSNLSSTKNYNDGVLRLTLF
jgi:hypothetical protein